MAIQNVVLGTTDTNVFVSSVPSAVTAIYLCNTDTVPVTFNLFAVKSGDAASLLTNVIYHDVIVSPGDTYVIDSERIILDIGDTIVAYANVAAKIVTTVSYLGL